MNELAGLRKLTNGCFARLGCSATAQLHHATIADKKAQKTLAHAQCIVNSLLTPHTCCLASTVCTVSSTFYIITFN